MAHCVSGVIVDGTSSCEWYFNIPKTRRASDGQRVMSGHRIGMLTDFLQG